MIVETQKKKKNCNNFPGTTKYISLPAACVGSFSKTRDIRVGVKGFLFFWAEVLFSLYSFALYRRRRREKGVEEEKKKLAAVVVQPPVTNRKRRGSPVHLRRLTVT